MPSLRGTRQKPCCHLFLLEGRLWAYLIQSPRKTSVATVGNNVLGTILRPLFSCSLTLVAFRVVTGCIVSCSPAPNCCWEIIEYRLMH